MNTPMPALDDRTFDDLVGEAITLLPTLAPEWTNHNPSDPGITLIELLAYFTEILVYRLGRITPTTRLQFLKLLGGAKWEGLDWESKLEFLRLLMGSHWEGWRTITSAHPSDLEKEIDCAVIQASPAQLEKAIEYAIQDLLKNECAVTAQDFERIAYEAAREYLGPQPSIRTLCLPSVNLEAVEARSAVRTDPAHVSIVLVPGREAASSAIYDSGNGLYKKVQQELLSRCLLTTRVHVLPPVYLHLAIGLKLAPKPGQPVAQLPGILRGAFEQRFGPELGQGPLGKGWPFGKALTISELIETVDASPGVDYVEYVTILQASTGEEELPLPEFALGLQIGRRSTIGVDSLLGVSRRLGPDRLRRNDAGKLVGIVLRPWELLQVTIAEDDIWPIDKKPDGTDVGAGNE